MSLALMPRMATAARAVVWAAVRERRVVAPETAVMAKVPEAVGTWEINPLTLIHKIFKIELQTMITCWSRTRAMARGTQNRGRNI